MSLHVFAMNNSSKESLEIKTEIQNANSADE
jgi:hypothetical protein